MSELYSSHLAGNQDYNGGQFDFCQADRVRGAIQCHHLGRLCRSDRSRSITLKELLNLIVKRQDPSRYRRSEHSQPSALMNHNRLNTNCSKRSGQRTLEGAPYNPNVRRFKESVEHSDATFQRVIPVSPTAHQYNYKAPPAMGDTLLGRSASLNRYRCGLETTRGWQGILQLAGPPRSLPVSVL